MIEEPKALTVKHAAQRPTRKQIAAFQGVATGFVVDALFGTGAMEPDITPLGGHKDHVAGPALTIDNRPSDVLALLAAGPFVQKGDIVINAFAGFQGCAAAGDRVAGMLKNSGAIGLVTDGPMRDFAGVMEVGLPCWCRGLHPNSPYATGPGRIGLPIQIGARQVESGDMIVADQDGVVVVPFAKIDEVIAGLALVAILEVELDAKVANGLRIPEAIEDLLSDPNKVNEVP
ncbi:MAG: RraA family protein [Aliishimia sp.]